jgi:hypothetical protein
MRVLTADGTARVPRDAELDALERTWWQSWRR